MMEILKLSSDQLQVTHTFSRTVVLTREQLLARKAKLEASLSIVLQQIAELDRQ